MPFTRPSHSFQSLSRSSISHSLQPLTLHSLQTSHIYTFISPLPIPIMSPPWKVTFSSDFYLASGTITVDLPARKVLIIHDLTSKTYYLPRGRKDWSEPLEATAIRETYEEAGCTATLLPVPLSTRCTPPFSTSTHNPQLQKARFDPSGDVLLPNTARLTEPIALMQHPQKKNGALAIVLWYVAIGDSTLPLAKETQMSDEQFEALWVGFEEGPGMMVNHACEFELAQSRNHTTPHHTTPPNADHGWWWSRCPGPPTGHRPRLGSLPDGRHGRWDECCGGLPRPTTKRLTAVKSQNLRGR